MKFNCDYFKQRWAAEQERKLKEFENETKWHSWFAWYPVKVAEGDCRWMETVQRRVNCLGLGYYSAFYRKCWAWDYRVAQSA